MIDSKGGAFGFDCCLALPKFRVFQQPARRSDFYPKAQITQMAVQKMQVGVQKMQVKTIVQLCITP